MSKAIRAELVADHRLSIPARLLGILLSDNQEGMEPSEAVRVLGQPRSTVHRWAYELRSRSWLEIDGRTKNVRWRLIRIISETLLASPAMRDGPTSDANEAPIRIISETSASASRAFSEIQDPSGKEEIREEEKEKHISKASESSGSDHLISTRGVAARASESAEKFSGKTLEKKSRPSKRWPAGLEATPTMRQIAMQRGLDFELEFSKLRDHEFRAGHSDWPATGANWMRNARPERNGYGYQKPPGLAAHEQYQRPPSQHALAILERAKREVSGGR